MQIDYVILCLLGDLKPAVATMLSFLAKQPPRTRTAHLTRFDLDDGRSTVDFNTASDAYLVMNRLPPAPKPVGVGAGVHAPNCALNPPMHWHSQQTETFHILQGKAIFHLEGAEEIASSGEIVHIPLAAHHTFRNASAEDDLLIEFTLDPSKGSRDEKLFRVCIAALFNRKSY